MWWECSECGGLFERVRAPEVCEECGTASGIFASTAAAPLEAPDNDDPRAAWTRIGFELDAMARYTLRA